MVTEEPSLPAWIGAALPSVGPIESKRLIRNDECMSAWSFGRGQSVERSFVSCPRPKLTAFETGREQSPDFVAALGATSPSVRPARKIEDGIVTEKSHDLIEIVSVKSVQKRFERADADVVICVHVLAPRSNVIFG